MLSRPLTLNKSDDRGRSLSAATPPSALPLADEEETGGFSPPVPTWSSSSSSSSPSSPPVGRQLSPPLLSAPSSARSPSTMFLPTPITSSVFSPPVAPSPVAPSLLPLSSVPFTCISSSPSFHFPPLSPTPTPASLHHLTSPIVSPPPAPPSPSLNPLHVSPSVSCPPPPVHASSSPPLVASSALSSSSCSSSLPALAYYSSPPPPPRPAAPPPCCPCSSLLPRLLSVHRLEMRRLLRGALASISHRLDALERRSRKRKKSRSKQSAKGSVCSAGSLTFASTSTCSPAPLPAVASSSSSSSSDCEESLTLLPPLSFSQSEQKRKRGKKEVSRRKRRRKNNREGEITESKDEEEEEEDGRFVGRMAVSFMGGREAEKDAPLTLQSFSQRKHNSQSEKAIGVMIRKNGHRVLPQLYGSSYQHALQLLQSSQSARTCGQSEAFTLSLRQWCFSDINPPLSHSSNISAFRLWLRPFSSSSFSSAPMLHLKGVAVEMVSDLIRGEACWSPTRPLKDRTAPPSLSSDHCYVRKPSPSPTCPAPQQQKQRTNRSARSLHLSWRSPLPLPACSANEFTSPLPAVQSGAGSKLFSRNGETGKRVSQIRIRRASPREMPLTPMGLPKVKRLKKKEFSLEEIYTNKNYKSPTSNRSLETIFEEPREKDGALLLIGQQRRRRLLLFPDFTQPRKRKRPQGAGLPVTMMPRKRMAARRHCHGSCDDDADLDVMLVERLSALEDFLTRQGLDV